MKKLTKLFEDAIKNNEQELQEILSEVEQASGKMSLEEKFRFIELYEEDNYGKPKDKRKEEVIKRGKYRVEIRTSTGTKIRTASSQKGLLDVIHGAKNFRVIDERSNKDVTTQIKKFIETRNKQVKNYDKKPKSGLKEDFSIREFTLRLERSKILNEFRYTGLGNLLKPVMRNIDVDSSSLIRTIDDDGSMSMSGSISKSVDDVTPTSNPQFIENSSKTKPLLTTAVLGALGLAGTGAPEEQAGAEVSEILPIEYQNYENELTSASKLIGGIMRSKSESMFKMKTQGIGPIRDVTTVSEIM